MIRAILAVSLGGALGSVLRYQAGVFSAKHFHTNFPLSTFLINISGCFLVGIFFALSVKYNWLTQGWQLFLITGFCGGVTTFSAFAFENFKLIQSGQIGTFLSYSLLSFALSLLAVLGGVNLLKLF